MHALRVKEDIEDTKYLESFHDFAVFIYQNNGKNDDS